ncbi:hypothetical protein GUI12_00990 [Anaplasmataceae bacterium AB001_6]|nr:hypothetical protein GUI12_00990 [Anaplasmataceae bacterium AB001_6]
MIDFIRQNAIMLALALLLIAVIFIIFLILKKKYHIKIVYRVYYQDDYEEILNKEYHEKKLKELKQQIQKENEVFKEKQRESAQEVEEITAIKFAIPIGKWTKLIFGEKINDMKAIKSLVNESIKKKKKIGIWQIKLEATKQQIAQGKKRGRGM